MRGSVQLQLQPPALCDSGIDDSVAFDNARTVVNTTLFVQNALNLIFVLYECDLISSVRVSSGGTGHVGGGDEQ